MFTGDKISNGLVSLRIWYFYQYILSIFYIEYIYSYESQHYKLSSILPHSSTHLQPYILLPNHTLHSTPHPLHPTSHIHLTHLPTHLHPYPTRHLTPSMSPIPISLNLIQPPSKSTTPLLNIQLYLHTSVSLTTPLHSTPPQNQKGPC